MNPAWLIGLVVMLLWIAIAAFVYRDINAQHRDDERGRHG